MVIPKTGLRSRPIKPPMLVPLNRQPLKTDLRRTVRDHIRHHAARARRHGPAQRAVAGRQVKIGDVRAAEDGRAIGRHGPQAAPELGPAYVAPFGKEVGHDMVQG